MVLSFSVLTFAKTPLAELAERSIESESDAVIIVHDTKEIFRYLPEGEDQLIETMSMTKSFASLAIGFLINENKIFSIDEPLVKWFPEWKNSSKAKITLRHILTHTSGLEANPDAGDIYEQKDDIKYALDATLKDEPGAVHFYNNKAVNLIAGIIKKASGKSVD